VPDVGQPGLDAQAQVIADYLRMHIYTRAAAASASLGACSESSCEKNKNKKSSAVLLP
jgi:hypothetical protein